jgi:hypothetical protein
MFGCELPRRRQFGDLLNHKVPSIQLQRFVAGVVVQYCFRQVQVSGRFCTPVERDASAFAFGVNGGKWLAFDGNITLVSGFLTPVSLQGFIV